MHSIIYLIAHDRYSLLAEKKSALLYFSSSHANKENPQCDASSRTFGELSSTVTPQTCGYSR